MLFHQQLLTQQALFVEPDFRFSFPSIPRHPPPNGGAVVFALLLLRSGFFPLVFALLFFRSEILACEHRHPSLRTHLVCTDFVSRGFD